MARYVFITGGVVSSLGKGLASAALGALLQARGFSVRLRKLDPYLNVDPGTMSPFEHGEVFVTDDGAETDLDLGHYERFTGVSARKTDSVSSGRIYSNVLEKERRGDYLGKTIQVIPHVTNEIKDFLRVGEDEVDFMLCEIGGTVGDIEGLPFFEAIRQFAQDKPRGQCIFVHLTLLPYVSASGELKTKPTQHSVKELRSIGIAPDVLLLRSERAIPEKEREKIALFCNVRKEAVIAAYDLKTIYEAPLAYHREGLDQAVLDAFGISPAPKPNLDRWVDVMDRLENAEGEVRVAIVGKYTQLEDAYKSIAEALTHGGMANRTRVRAEWINAELFEREDPSPFLEGFHAILVPGGFGERGTEGKIRAAQYAREKAIPYLGICLGMQMAVIEAARNLAQVKDAGSEEFDHEVGKKRFTPVVYHLKEWIQGNHIVERKHDDDKGGTMRLGAYTAALTPGSRVSEIYHATEIEERHRHRYEGGRALPRGAGGLRADLLRDEPGWAVARDRRDQGSSVVHRRAVPPRAQVEALRAASAVRRFRARRGRGVAAGLRPAAGIAQSGGAAFGPLPPHEGHQMIEQAVGRPDAPSRGRGRQVSRPAPPRRRPGAGGPDALLPAHLSRGEPRRRAQARAPLRDARLHGAEGQAAHLYRDPRGPRPLRSRLGRGGEDRRSRERHRPARGAAARGSPLPAAPARGARDLRPRRLSGLAASGRGLPARRRCDASGGASSAGVPRTGECDGALGRPSAAGGRVPRRAGADATYAPARLHADRPELRG